MGKLNPASLLGRRLTRMGLNMDKLPLVPPEVKKETKKNDASNKKKISTPRKKV